jgi:hypothetical protein
MVRGSRWAVLVSQCLSKLEASLGAVVKDTVIPVSLDDLDICLTCT